MPPEAADTVLKKARGIVAEFGAAVLRVELGTKEGRTDVVPYEPAIRLGANGNGNAATSALGAVPRISA
jgi:hypothetical protein